MRIVRIEAIMTPIDMVITKAEYTDDVPEQDMIDISDIGHSRQSNYDAEVITSYVDMDFNKGYMINTISKIKHYFRGINLDKLIDDRT